MHDMERTVIPPKSGKTFLVDRGSTIRVIDLEGGQVADFVCFNASDYAEHFSQANTRLNNGRVRISEGDRLFSNASREMFEISRDTVKVHDLLFPPCNAYVYENILGAKGRHGCLENLASALKPYGIAEGQVPNPFNIFMHTSIDDDHRLHINLPFSKAGDMIELSAKMDCLVAISACAEDISDCNAHHCTTIGVEIV
jgi:uncharacterized protein YcgI (DUF1989 family)